MQALLDQIMRTFGAYALNIGAAILILIVGWLVALLIASLVRKVLEKVSFDNRLMAKLGFEGAGVKIETIISQTVYYLLMLLVVVAVLETLQLTLVTEPLNQILSTIFGFLPKLLGAAAYILLAWVLATAARFIVTRALGAFKLDDTLSSQVELQQEGQPPLSDALGTIVYWFIFLLFLPSILGALEMQGTLAPIVAMLTSVMTYLPNILAAGLIFVIGWYAAQIIRRIVVNFLVALGTDRLGERVGMGAATGGQTLSGVIGTIVYVVVLIPVLISALQALQIAAISTPATNMLNSLLAAIPIIFGAMIVLVVTYFIARIVADLVKSLLTGIGFNRVLTLIGLGSEPDEGQRTPAEIAGYLVLVGLMLFAAVEAAQLLGFSQVAVLVSDFLVFAGQILLGVVILGIGLYLANVARDIILSTAGAQAKILAQVARVAIIILTVAMGLRQMGIANDIVNLAFGLLLGAVAVAAALAFGLGSREIAGREMEGLVKQLRAKGKE